jgi:hypothetical protein
MRNASENELGEPSEAPTTPSEVSAYVFQECGKLVKIVEAADMPMLAYFLKLTCAEAEIELQAPRGN